MKNKDVSTKLLTDILAYIGEYVFTCYWLLLVIDIILMYRDKYRLFNWIYYICSSGKIAFFFNGNRCNSTSLTCTLGDVRSYLCSVLRTEDEQTQADAELTEKYRADTLKLREQIEAIKNSTIIFQGSRCSACHHQLELPSVHFMCQHSYHQQWAIPILLLLYILACRLFILIQYYMFLW